MNLQTEFGIDGSQSLESLEGPMTHYDIPTALMARVEKLTRVPLSSIDDEGLRLLLVQRMFLKSVVPAALILLEREPLSGGNLELGALMGSLFQFTPAKFWKESGNCFSFAQSMLKTAKDRLELEIDSERDPENRAMLLEAKENFEKADRFSHEMQTMLISNLSGG